MALFYFRWRIYNPTIFIIRVSRELLAAVLMIPRLLLRFSCVVLCVSEVTISSIAVDLPIDVVRASTIGNGSFECFENQYDMPLVFWHRESLEPKLSLIRSLSKHDVTIEHGQLHTSRLWICFNILFVIFIFIYRTVDCRL